MQTYAEQLRAVRDSLTQENWNQGSWFTRKNNTICMCVHGAAQAIVNSEVKKALEINDYYSAKHRVRAKVRIERAALLDNLATINLQNIWLKRPDWVKKDYTYKDENYGNTNLHYLMGMFGITVKFNDHPDTTLDMIKDKLSEAAKWAEENEEFLQNN